MAPLVREREQQPRRRFSVSNDSSKYFLPNPTVADKVAIGTEQILESPHVTEGPGRIANAPVPSVFVSKIVLQKNNIKCCQRDDSSATPCCI